MRSENHGPRRNAESLFKSISALPMEEASDTIDYYCNKAGDERDAICLIINNLVHEER